VQKLVETILLVLFSFTLETALQTAASGLTRHPTARGLFAAIAAHPEHYLFGVLQWIAFVITLCRFFFGAYRFHSEANVTSTRGELQDAAMTILLFIVFYLAALLVTQRELFLFAIASIHVVDLLWFVIPNTIPSHIESAGRHYAVYDVLTIGALGVVYVAYIAAEFDPEWLAFWTALVLIAMAIIDIKGPTSNWYFDPDKWRREHASDSAAMLSV
jgi:hypothetical protein